ncbi:MAG: hypothetical protein WB713_01645 [Methyloceanibacter sp.]
MRGDFAKCGCCVTEPKRKPASPFEALIAEIDKILASPEKTTRTAANGTTYTVIGSRALGSEPSNLWLELTFGRAVQLPHKKKASGSKREED